MDAIKALSSFRFEVKIMSAKNIQVTNSKGYLFVRCYLSAGNNKRVRLESQKVSPNENICWRESFSLDCIARQSVDAITHGNVVFELRSRTSTTPFLKKFIGGNANVRGSQLLGRGEVSWRSILESPNMESERWLAMRSKKADIKEPSICVSMKIQTPQVEVMNETKTKVFGKLKNKLDESCGCSHGHCCETSCIDSELFAIGFALDAF
ncbi:hypothetical protein L1887_28823 [Cichorium endivia]|nr:hypothetical protein L1887_28823 [Cichorium endivia]